MKFVTNTGEETELKISDVYYLSFEGSNISVMTKNSILKCTVEDQDKAQIIMNEFYKTNYHVLCKIFDEDSSIILVNVEHVKDNSVCVANVLLISFSDDFTASFYFELAESSLNTVQFKKRLYNDNQRT